MKPGTLCDHSDCYREICHVERERDDLRLELAELRARLLLAESKLHATEGLLAAEASW